MAELSGWHAVQGFADLVVAISLFALAGGVVLYVRRRRGLLSEFRIAAWLTCCFIVACGASYLLSALAVWQPPAGALLLIKIVTAVLSAAAVGMIWPLLPGLARLPSSHQLAEVNRQLRQEAESHEMTLRELEAARHDLESRVRERTSELSLVNARFETALHGAKIYAFSQDRDLRYTWISRPAAGSGASDLVGRSDAELFPAHEQDEVVAAKRRVLATGESADLEVSSLLGERALFALHIDPTYGPDRTVSGIMGAAIDISRIRSLESEQRRLTRELASALQRYETALRGSHVTVYTQDRDLRYTSISNPLFGREIEEIVGRLDEDILPPQSLGPLAALKRKVLETGQAADGEFRIPEKTEARWYDMHIEPLRDVIGAIVGLTCAAVDITNRKAGEAHLIELMRELTHRSKNLLAVIQAMARQTARHSGTTEEFLDQFGARLQALAASHDLLVQESWYGASLSELVRSQLGHYLDRSGAQIAVEGPALLLKPEAAQGIGLAIHELATNAAKYGALSVPTGQVAITWRLQRPNEGGAIELVWSETGGPPVRRPGSRGFGSLVIERNLSRSLEAEIELAFPPEGVRCRMVIPATHLATAR